jgi:hypothetical protein
MRRYQYDIPGRYDMVTFRNKRIRNNKLSAMLQYSSQDIAIRKPQPAEAESQPFPLGWAGEYAIFRRSDAGSCNPAMRTPSPLRPKGMARSWA